MVDIIEFVLEGALGIEIVIRRLFRKQERQISASSTVPKADVQMWAPSRVMEVSSGMPQDSMFGLHRTSEVEGQEDRPGE